MDEPPLPADTTTDEYARRLEGAVALTGWRRYVDPQIPYRWNIRRLQLGRVLDVGCGVGRNLAHLDGNGVGVDHNPTSVNLARQRGLVAYTPDEFARSPQAVAGSFDTLLCAHVLEHLDETDARALLTDYLPFVRPGGRVVAICPQQRGQASDPTHLTFFDPATLQALLTSVGLVVQSTRSFPLPAAAGRWFTHNETIVVTRQST